eukprot:6199685-Pleurochrysis_carterae.AAC.3
MRDSKQQPMYYLEHLRFGLCVWRRNPQVELMDPASKMNKRNCLHEGAKDQNTYIARNTECTTHKTQEGEYALRLGMRVRA